MNTIIIRASAQFAARGEPRRRKSQFKPLPKKKSLISSLLYGEHELLMSDGVKIRLGRAFREKLKILLPGVSNR